MQSRVRDHAERSGDPDASGVMEQLGSCRPSPAGEEAGPCPRKEAKEMLSHTPRRSDRRWPWPAGPVNVQIWTAQKGFVGAARRAGCLTYTPGWGLLRLLHSSSPPPSKPYDVPRRPGWCTQVTGGDRGRPYSGRAREGRATTPQAPLRPRLSARGPCILVRQSFARAGPLEILHRKNRAQERGGRTPRGGRPPLQELSTSCNPHSLPPPLADLFFLSNEI